MSQPIFSIQREFYGSEFTVRFAILHEDGSLTEAQPVEMVHRKQAIVQELKPPMLSFSGFSGDAATAMQSLMDELWRNGVRPSDIGTPGHLAAAQFHLKDMRALVSKLADVKLD